MNGEANICASRDIPESIQQAQLPNAGQLPQAPQGWDHEQHVPGAFPLGDPPGQISHGVEQHLESEDSENAELKLWSEIEDAIRAGDSITTTGYEGKGEAERRALLIGGQYDNDSRMQHGEALAGSPIDVLNVYRMLISRGYEKENIRILIERPADEDTDRYETRPTKQNIMNGLNWLVRDARENDRRYFHFSGHGEIFENDAGKEAREIPMNSKSVKEDDTEHSGDPTIQLQIRSQTVAPQEIKHYSEDNNFKLRGAGFRGSMIVGCKEQPTQHVSQTELLTNSHNQRNHREVDEEVNPGDGPNNESVSKLGLEQLSLDGVTRGAKFDIAEESNTVDGPLNTQEVALTKVYYFCPPQSRAPTSIPVTRTENHLGNDKLTMDEKLPKKEIEKDNIKAYMLTWSSCHQRQQALEHPRELRIGGYFTSEFVKAVNGIRGEGSVKVVELYDIVNDGVVAKMKEDSKNRAKTGGANPQYIQLWTSLGGNTEDSARGKLLDNFII
ncbi:unnamed protein product [Rhizoctonia solani]|uniref:Peptidase C14 caspase domain-containing protein n=1 Tax=Rhizoctonia solani TaxID=456999 RepID=A0A8H3AH47_9AGAM|nr:unnamed protein product [Rhizoctonia solani]